MSFATQLIDNLRDLAYNPQLQGNARAISNALKQCTSVIWRINRALEKETSIRVKKHLSTCLGQARSYREIIKTLKTVGGSNSQRKETAHDRVKWADMKSAFKGRMRTAVITNTKHIEPKAFMQDCSTIFQRRILNTLKKDASLKVNTALTGVFEVKKGSTIIEEIKYINTKNAAIYQDSNLAQWFKINIQDSILKDLEEFQQKDSGWTLKSIINLQLNINKYTQQLGSSY